MTTLQSAAALLLSLVGCVHTVPSLVRDVHIEPPSCAGAPSVLVVQTCDLRLGPFTNQWVNCWEGAMLQ